MTHYYKNIIDDEYYDLFMFDDTVSNRLPNKKDWSQFLLDININEDYARGVSPVEISFSEFRELLNRLMADLMALDDEREYSDWFLTPAIYTQHRDEKSVIIMPSQFFYEMPIDYLINE